MDWLFTVYYIMAINKVTAGLSGLAAIAALSVGMLQEPADDPKLNSYQMRCAQALAYFIHQIPQQIPGAQVTLGEAHRPTWVAAEYARRGLGISTSLHIQRLAVDLMLFRDGVYQTSSEAYRPLANLWKTIAPFYVVVPGVGIDFNDGNHFSCAYGGRK
jgi:hypothetical protein